MFQFNPLLTLTYTSLVLCRVTTTLTGIAATAPTLRPSNMTARLPAMGWYTSGSLECDVNEADVLAGAQQMLSWNSNYTYVVVDYCWAEDLRDAFTGRLVPNATRFPNGIDGLASKIHDMGLQFGVGSTSGTITCDGAGPGSLGKESLDATTFAEWGVDYIKYDNCNIPANWTDAAVPPNGDWYNSNSAIRYRQMTAALGQNPRPIQFSINIKGLAEVWTWGSRVGHNWRMAGNGAPTWNYTQGAINVNSKHLDAIGFFGHNDMGPFAIGNGNLTIEEQRTQFGVYAFMKNPLIMDTRLDKLSPEELAIVTNREFITFNQDPSFAAAAVPYNSSSTPEVITAPEFYKGLSSVGTHVFVINTLDEVANKTIDLADFSDVYGSTGEWVLHDMWTGETSSTVTGSYTFSLGIHDTAGFLLQIVQG